jgi:hypothetical protein
MSGGFRRYRAEPCAVAGGRIGRRYVVVLGAALLGGAAAGATSGMACIVVERCFVDEDCAAPQICCTEADTCAQGQIGQCGYACMNDDDCACPPCVDNRCEGNGDDAIACPEDMVNINNCFCIDRYEASRPDATESAPGTTESHAVSRPRVMPWRLSEGDPQENRTAQDACEAAGKTLCASNLWRAACEGSRHTTYGYGDEYDPGACNGIDTFGRDDFHLLPTGSMPECTSEVVDADGTVVDAAYDMNGNLWEHVLGGSTQTIRGGAFNCGDSKTYHRCDYVPGDWSPSARGFRCCFDPRVDSSATP